MKYILAIDSFKGCLSSVETENAAYDAVRMRFPEAEIVSIPVSDGGEGMLEAFVKAMKGDFVSASSHDPMMRPISVSYGIVNDIKVENGVEKHVKTAVIESAMACGLALLKPEELNPLVATSYGLGEIIADAIGKGCVKFIIGLGGSATSDCGIGMLRALIESFGDNKERNWDSVSSVFDKLEFILACDVNNPLYGENGAARIYSPQKGATPEQVEILDNRAKKFASMSAEHFGFDCSNNPGAGAAGGLGYAFMQYLGAKMRSGADLLLDLVDFDLLVRNSDLVITGEGSADSQTLMGKLPYVIMKRAKKANVPVLLIAGRIKERETLIEAGFYDVLCINPTCPDDAECMNPEIAKERIKKTISEYLKHGFK